MGSVNRGPVAGNEHKPKPAEGHCFWKCDGQWVAGEVRGGQSSQGLCSPAKELSLYSTQSESSEGLYAKWQQDRIYSSSRSPYLQCEG